MPSTYHQVIKFPTPLGVKKILRDQTTARECYKTCVKSTINHNTKETPVASITGSEKLAEVNISTGDNKVLKRRRPLFHNRGKFSWKYEDITGISPDAITHKLNVDPQYTPVQQKRKKFVTERNKFINEEMSRLLKAGMIREVDYSEWLANVIIVQKKNGKWRVCVNYTDLNKACPKDPYPLPHIDTMVDSKDS